MTSELAVAACADTLPPMSILSADRKHATLALSFEPNGDGYLYYRDRWARGIPVTSAERDAYLHAPVLASRRAWHDSIDGRETLPPRPYGPVRRKLKAAMPLRVAVFDIVFGLFILLASAAGLRSGDSVRSLLGSLLFLALGGGMFAWGISLVIARLTRDKAELL
jgi:hypothetical protein